MSGAHIRQTGKASLLNEADMEGMVFNTPVPFYDMCVSCGNPMETGNVPMIMMMMPLRAAIEAGAIRRPTWAEYGSEFGFKRTSKTSLSDYTDPTKNKYADEQQFWTMVDDFRKLIARK